MLNKLTKLGAVNILLKAIGQSPISSLSQTTVDVTGALQEIDKCSREVQTDGWQFNREDDYTLTPDTSGNITTSDNILRVDLDVSVYPLTEYDVTLRGNRLYNKVTGTYTFPDTLTASVVVGLEWDELPEHVRSYITLKARRRFQDDTQGNDSAHSAQTQDELEAYTRFKRLEGQQEDANFLDWHAKRYGPRSF